MSSLEKRAWFELAVALAAIAGWLALYFSFHSVGASMAAFSVLAVTAWSGPGQDGPALDERDRAIAEWGVTLGLRTLYMAAVAIPVGLGLLWGWDQTVSVAILAQAVCFAWVVLLLVRGVAIIAKYRSVPYGGE